MDDDDDNEANGESSSVRKRNDLRGRGEAYKKEVEREVERIKVKVGFSGFSLLDAATPSYCAEPAAIVARDKSDTSVGLLAVSTDC